MLNQSKSYELTTAQLKKHEGFENVTEEEAKEIIFQLRELSFIFYVIFKNQSDRESMLSSSRASVDNHKRKRRTKYSASGEQQQNDTSNKKKIQYENQYGFEPLSELPPERKTHKEK